MHNEHKRRFIVIGLALFFWTLIVTVPVVAAVSLLCGLAWFFGGLPLGPGRFATAVCLLSLPAVRFVHAWVGGFEPADNTDMRAMAEFVAAASYVIIGGLWLAGMLVAIVMRFVRPAPFVLNPRLAIAGGVYALVLIVLAVAPTIIQARRAGPREALAAAVLGNDIASVERLILAGVDPGRSYGALGSRNLMVYALDEARPALVALLLDLGERGTLFPMHYLSHATSSGNPELVGLFLDHGADVNGVDGDPLNFAAQGGHAEVMRLLLERGADPNRHGSSGWTALMVVANNQPRPELVELLLDHGAELNLRNEVGQTALTIAQNKGHDTIAVLLRDAGAES